MKQSSTVRFFLRLSISSVFLFAAVSSLFDPQDWIGYFPQILRNLFPAQFLLLGFSAYELLLGGWILSGWRIFYASILASITMLGIISSNFGAIEIVFRDFAIFFAAIALAIDSKG